MPPSPDVFRGRRLTVAPVRRCVRCGVGTALDSATTSSSHAVARGFDGSIRREPQTAMARAATSKTYASRFDPNMPSCRQWYRTVRRNDYIAILGAYVVSSHAVWHRPGCSDMSIARRRSSFASPLRYSVGAAGVEPATHSHVDMGALPLRNAP